MIDVWMIFTMTIPLFEIVGHTYSESLKKELAAEWNPKIPPIDSLPRNSVSVHHPPALQEANHSEKRSKATMLCWCEVERKNKRR